MILSPLQKKQIAAKFFHSLVNKDFINFCSFIKIKDLQSGKFISFDYNNWNWEQQTYFNTKRETREGIGQWDIVVKPRRIGMTTFGCLQDYFFALSHPSTNTMILAHQTKFAKENIELIRDIHWELENLGKELGFSIVPTLSINNVFKLKFSNGSQIISEVANSNQSAARRTARGLTVDRLHCTETALYSYPTETMTAVLEAASKAKEILIESTSQGASGWFYEQVMLCEQGGQNNTFNLFFFPWFKSKNCYLEARDIQFIAKNEWEDVLIHKHKINHEQLAWWRAKEQTIGLDQLLQEYPIDIISCFRNKSSTFINIEDDAWLSSCVKKPRREQSINDLNVLFWREPKDREEYVMGIDTGYGAGGDNSVLIVLDSQGQIVSTAASNELRPSQFAKAAMEVATFFNEALVAIERQGPGQSVLDFFEDNQYVNLFKHDDKDYYGWNTNNLTRTRMFHHISDYISGRENEIYDENLVKELRTIVVNKNNLGEKPEANKGFKDDRVLAFGIALCAFLSGQSNRRNGFEYRSGKSLDVRRNSFGQAPGRSGKGFV